MQGVFFCVPVNLGMDKLVSIVLRITGTSLTIILSCVLLWSDSCNLINAVTIVNAAAASCQTSQ